MRQIIQMIKDKLLPPDGQKGQSLVELAIITPLLLMLMLGMVEVGAALRSYMVVSAANREAARFAARGRYGNDAIAQVAIDAMADQLPVEASGPEANVSVIITTISIHKDPEPTPAVDPPQVITGTTETSRINPAALALQLKAENDAFNATMEAAHPGVDRSGNRVVIIEIIYYHEQVLNVPLIAQILPNPIPIYTRTMMRVTGDARFE